MHPIESSGTSSVPAFLAKLWRLVEEQETNSLISWSQASFSFFSIKYGLKYFRIFLDYVLKLFLIIKVGISTIYS
jgi:hypothetical protein